MPGVDYEIVLRNGEVVDGTGAPRRRADVAISGDRIVAVAGPDELEIAPGTTVFDVGGNVVSPGFIDVHTHDDNAVLVGPDMTPKISQGVTTVIVGNCGISLAPILLTGRGEPTPPLHLLGGDEHFRFDRVSDYVDAVAAARPQTNVAILIGHSTLRVATLADITRKASSGEIDSMRARLAEGLDAGAIGFSTGLYYKPNAPADIDEVAALAELLTDSGGIYVTHMRDEHDHVLDSLAETFETADRARVPVVVSHHKCSGPANWGRSRETLPVIERASRQRTVGLDAYPYAAGSTVLDPDWVNEEIRILVTWSRSHPNMPGADLVDVARDWGCSQRDAAVRLHPAGAIYFQMDEADVQRILAYPPTMIGSDGLPHDSHPHPRLWGTFPRVLGHYCRDIGLFTLEAVHKMTGLSAETFGLKDRGIVREGAFADLVVFNPETIEDRATFEDPKQASAGVELVVVNGGVAWVDGAVGTARRGRIVGHA